MKDFVDSTEEKIFPGVSGPRSPRLAEFIQHRLVELHEEFQDSGRLGFSNEAVRALELVCDFVNENQVNIMPAIFEGDERCFNIVYANRNLSRRMSVDISACGSEIEIWHTDDDDSRLMHRGEFDANELHSALLWLSPPEKRRKITPALAA